MKTFFLNSACTPSLSLKSAAPPSPASVSVVACLLLAVRRSHHHLSRSPCISCLSVLASLFVVTGENPALFPAETGPFLSSLLPTQRQLLYSSSLSLSFAFPSMFKTLLLSSIDNDICTSSLDSTCDFNDARPHSLSFPL